MRSPDGRVEAGPGERPPGRQRVDVDPELGKTASGGTERVPVTGRNEPGTVQERDEDGDAHVAGQVVVTGPREAEARRVVVGLQRVDRNAWTHPPEGLERFGDLGAREPVATVAPVRGDGDEAPVDERPEMAARGRRRDPGAARELRGTGLPPVEEDPEHRRARWARKQATDRGVVDVHGAQRTARTLRRGPNRVRPPAVPVRPSAPGRRARGPGVPPGARPTSRRAGAPPPPRRAVPRRAGARGGRRAPPRPSGRAGSRAGPSPVSRSGPGGSRAAPPVLGGPRSVARARPCDGRAPSPWPLARRA